MTVLPDREEYYHYLKDRLPTAEFVLDENRQAFDTFMKALDTAGKDAILLMEDDAYLTKDFENKVQAVVDEHPDDVINFFSRRKKDLEIGARYESGSTFSYTLCIYFPEGVAYELKQYAEDWYKENKEEHPTGTDIVIGDFITDIKGKYFQQVPSLVQHRVGVSAINSRRARDRTSKTFKDPWE